MGEVGRGKDPATVNQEWFRAELAEARGEVGDRVDGADLTGRLGALAPDEFARAVAADFGVELGEAPVAGVLIQGAALEGVVSWRDATENEARAYRGLEIYSMRPDGGDVRRLTRNRVGDLWPRASRDDVQ